MDKRCARGIDFWEGEWPSLLGNLNNDTNCA